MNQQNQVQEENTDVSPSLIYDREKIRVEGEEDNAHQTWTDGELQRLKWRFISGMDLEKIAHLHRRTKAAISSKLESRGMIINRGGRLYKLFPWV